MIEDELNFKRSSQEKTFAEVLDLAGTLDLSFALYGTHPIFLINQQQSLSSTEMIPYKVFLSPGEITEYVRRGLLIRPHQHFIITVFDGQKGRVIVLTGYDQGSDSFLYLDSWEEGSFLARESNQAGVAAELVPGQLRTWQISRAEMEIVLYAIAFPPSLWAELKELKYQLFYADLQKSEFFSFFHLHEKYREALQDGQIRLWLETGGFQQFNELIFELDQKQRITQATLGLDRKWIISEGINSFALDIAKSFFAALIPPADANDAQPLINGLWELKDRTKAMTNLGVEGRQSPLPLPVRHVLLVYLGGEEHTQWVLLFSTIRAKNDRNRRWLNLSIDFHLQDRFV